ncbi:NEQ357 [Nanoarchaeum equitans Kin4-M]|uniref:NEQ357 n=1 Tax=Nanoarchaeum equitans (strain Kin4-M) TaxID=228908 RepID=Q74N02_NANEQ|nr:NEQ357 [Nanoarchaeum equitans Kin4-M]
MYKLYPIEVAKNKIGEKVLIAGICIERNDYILIDDGTETIKCYPRKADVDIGDYVLVAGKVGEDIIFVDGMGKISKQLYEYLKEHIEQEDRDLRNKILEYIDINDGATLEQIVKVFGEEAKKHIQKLLARGEIYEYEPGKFKKI